MKYLHWILIACMATTFAAMAMEQGITSQLLGNWVGDSDSAIEKMGLDTNATEDPTVKMMTAMLSGIKAKFTPDSVILDINMMGKTDQITTHYEVLETGDNSITIKNLDGQKKDTISIISFTTDDTIEIAEGNNKNQITYLRRAGTETPETEIAPPVEETVVTETVEEVPVIAEEIIETPVVAEEAIVEEPTAIEEDATPEVPRVMVILPEQIDTEWYWYFYTEISQNIVQAAVEKALVRAGIDVIDLKTINMFHDQGDINRLWDKSFTVNKAKEAGAAYIILGRATATKMSHDVAYGVNVFRSSTEITARLVRVSDGKILAVEDASATAGGQGQKAAGQDALKEAGKDIARKLTREVEKVIRDN